jgi:transaldolase
VNVTLLFSPAHYLACADTYTRAIERRVEAGLPAYVPSVASLFLSRWDTAVVDVVPAALKLQLGLAIARNAYAASVKHYATERWDRLREAGARPQRLHFASTGAKDPTASPVMYVTGLAAPGTINTMPEETLLALAEHTEDVAAIPTDSAASAGILAEFAAAGIDVDKLGQELQQKGAKSFVASLDIPSRPSGARASKSGPQRPAVGVRPRPRRSPPPAVAAGGPRLDSRRWA